MSRYRTIQCLIWNDDKFPFASDDCKLVWFHLRTTPLSTSMGIFKASIEGLAAEMRWHLPRYRETFAEGLAKGFWKVDERFHVVYFPNHFKYNKPTNPNVLSSWILMLDEIPDCNLKYECIQQLRMFAKGWGQQYVNVCQTLPQTLPKQEHEHEHEHEKEKEASCTAASSMPSCSQFFTDLPCKGKFEIFQVSIEYVNEMKPLYPGIDVEKEILRAKGWLINNPTKGKTHNGMKRYLGSWLARAQNDCGGNNHGPNNGSGKSKGVERADLFGSPKYERGKADE
jgi:hypothetical protein